MKERGKILFILPAMNLGGSETVVLHLIKNLDRDRFDIHLLVLKKEGALLSKIPRDINVIFCNHSRTAFSVKSVLLTVWRLRPRIIFSTLGHLNLLIAVLKPFLPRVHLCARESSIVSIRNKDERYPRLFNFLFKTVYNRFDTIICQSNYMRMDLVKNFAVKLEKIIVVNNPIDFRAIPSRPNREKTNVIKLLSVGNIRPEKGYERVLAHLSECKVIFEYRIIGAGDSSQLQQLVKKSEIEDKVHFMGQVLNPFPHYFEADCLLLGSYYEGFPNVVLEANACGLPVIAYQAPGGHNEIIRGGINGWFIEESEQLCELIDSRAFDQLDKDKIISLTKERYDLHKIIALYEQIFQKILG